MLIGESTFCKQRKKSGPLWALGLMSGTSLDGIDLALIRTDGKTVSEYGPRHTEPYCNELRSAIRGVLGGTGDTTTVERELTLAHAGAVKRFLKNKLYRAVLPDIIGFHGHTILHSPEARRTWQLGSGQLLADETGIPVVGSLRTEDVRNGGQGAPITPLYHSTLRSNQQAPFAILNIGGVANVTWVGKEKGDIIAFDTGPGGAQLDEWIELTTGQRLDLDGKLARAGTVDLATLTKLMKNSYFSRPPPKSADRINFSLKPIEKLSIFNGAATLVEFTCATVASAARFFPEQPRCWFLTGGGRKNIYLVERLTEHLGRAVKLVDNIGWDGDFLEAEAFAFLAVRSLFRMPITLPQTTGVDRPRTGGYFYHPT